MSCFFLHQWGRHEVLQTLTKNLTVDQEVDLRELSERTEGYTPADLKSLLVTAQLTRLEKQLAHNDDTTLGSVVVQQEDIDGALDETKPSLSREQLLFYDMIYKRFRGETLTSEQKIMAGRFEKQRATLA
ncbi:cell division cycle protein 48 homolog [Bombyx mandarina]|uniref:Cell division cycle protein 48 homolog n=1 Tax=Bombyx mandarina TaxID=7092 RepID=A0A6J2KND2_BOMMA|nr:cell division cycle protein 48 homolog [Bombyx mandarina]